MVLKGKKKALAQILYYSRLFRLANLRKRNRLIVINYHRIQSDDQNHSTFFDDETFGPTAREFEEQIRWLKTYMDVISEDDLVDFLAGTRPPPARSVMITFDDGYIDNYTLAYPILRQHHLPAIFFIPTLAIEERLLGWWDHVAYFLKTTKHESIVFAGKKISPKSDLQHAIHYVLTFIIYNYKNAESVLHELCKVCEVDLPSFEIQGKELMTWDNLKEVNRNGISIGAHSHSHRILSSLDHEAQKHELLQSKQIIEEKVGKTVRSLAYPVGHYIHFTEETKRLAVECGYKMAFSFLTGANTWSDTDPMDLKRISVSNYQPLFVGAMIAPSLFCNFKNYMVL